MAAEVLEVGSDVVGFAVGDRAFVPESHKEYAAVSSSKATKLSDSIPEEEGAFLHIMQVAHLTLRTGSPALGVCPRIRSWRRKPPRNNLLTVIWTLSWSN